MKSFSYATIDIVLALLFAFMVNAAILITAASVFHKNGHGDVVEIQHAYDLLSPLLDSDMGMFVPEVDDFPGMGRHRPDHFIEYGDAVQYFVRR